MIVLIQVIFMIHIDCFDTSDFVMQNAIMIQMIVLIQVIFMIQNDVMKQMMVLIQVIFMIHINCFDTSDIHDTKCYHDTNDCFDTSDFHDTHRLF